MPAVDRLGTHQRIASGSVIGNRYGRDLPCVVFAADIEGDIEPRWPRHSPELGKSQELFRTGVRTLIESYPALSYRRSVCVNRRPPQCPFCLAGCRAFALIIERVCHYINRPVLPISNLSRIGSNQHNLDLENTSRPSRKRPTA